MARISYIKFEFKKPPMLTEDLFIKYKYMLSIKPEISLNTETFWKTFRSAIMAMIYTSLITVILGLAAAQIFKSKDVASGISFIGGIVLFGIIISTVLSLPSYLIYKHQKNNYYKTEKRRVIESDTYIDFILCYEMDDRIREEKIIEKMNNGVFNNFQV